MGNNLEKVTAYSLYSPMVGVEHEYQMPSSLHYRCRLSILGILFLKGFAQAIISPLAQNIYATYKNVPGLLLGTLTYH